ncbi:MAG: amino acid adenylation domain-containing protein [Pontibacterium sp.]
MSEDHNNSERDENLMNGIAIIGMSGRFPGAETVEQFWRNLCDGVESITHFSDEELEDDFGPEVRNDPNFVKARPILENVDQFDADFFGMYAKEAQLTDPQQRVFLECAWESLEDAGYDPAKVDAPVGVFGGSSLNTYLLRNVCASPAVTNEFTSSYQVGHYPMLVGSAPDFFATRVSYKLDLKGPGISMNSACSTSLLAISQACQSLQMYQCDMALAGGVSITFPQKRGYLHQEGGMVSPDGHCRSFDAQAGGTIFGSGAGVVLLKRYEDALADGDRVYAVIRGCGVNNDGSDKVGFTAPSIDGQAGAISAALEAAEVDARSISYVECHGTGTPLGDPIEIAGLTKAYREHTEDRGYCAIGSVKTNVGHLDAAAGVTGLIKTALSLKNAKIPATLHFERPNPRINIESTPFHVNSQLTDWVTQDEPRRAGVSAFGVGGTNVHLVLEETPAVREKSPDDIKSPQLLVCSARTEAALQQATENLAAHLSRHPEQSLQDVAFTLMEGRRAFDHRAVLVASDANQAMSVLNSPSLFKGQSAESGRPVVFLFPGQGSQYPDMGRGLYEKEPVFRQAVDHCAEVLAPLMGVDLRDVLYPAADADRDVAAERLMSTIMAQPAIFTVEYATAQMWLQRGIKPAAMLGHSVGEWVAAVLAGVVSLADALALVAERGRLMYDVPAGAMLSVRLPEQDVRTLLNDELSLAAVNSPSLCVVAGPFDAIEALEATLVARDVIHRRLHTSHAFHSAMMEPVLAPLLAAVSQVKLSAPTFPVISCVSGQLMTDKQAMAPEYWANHAREAVRFAEGVTAAVQCQPNAVLLEMGPGNVLTTLARQCLRGVNVATATSLPDAERRVPDQDMLLEAFGRLWALGVEVDWSVIHQGQGARVSLPTYAFQRRRHWIDAPENTQAAQAAGGAYSLTEALEAGSIEQTETGADQNTEAAGSHPIRQQVLAVFEDLSGEVFTDISDDTTFIEMGFDSLFLTQVAQRIQKAFKVKLTFRQLLGDYNSPGALVAFLVQQIDPQALPQAAVAAGPASEGETEQGPEDQDAGSRFDVYQSGQTTSDTALSPEMVAHIAELAARSESRMRSSKQSTRAHRQVLADPRAAAGFRNEWKELVYPLVVDRCAGSKLWDLDGNEYVDLVNGYGQTFFGHSPDFVVDALREQLDKGFAIGPQAEYAGEVATLFAEITGNERVTFCNTGSEAVMAAMRLARAVTGRDKVVVFNGDYHGQFDEVLVKGVGKASRRRSQPIAGGIPREAVANMVVLEYGAVESLSWIQEHADDIAAVVVEPVQSRHPALQPFAFLRELRHITEQGGNALVFDEVVTGFRVHPGGIQAVTGIHADLATYGKVVGGGMPVGILAGKSQFMDALDGGQWDYGNDSFPEVGVTFFAGTFVRHPMTLAAVRAVLNHIQTQGPALQARMAQRTTDLVDKLNQLFDQFGLSTHIEHYSSFFYFNIHDEAALAGLLYYHLRERGVHIQDGYPCFLTTAHSDADIQFILDAFQGALAAMKDAGVSGVDKEATAAEPATAEVSEVLFPLTESQLEIWLSAQPGDAASCVFNESVSLHFKGKLDTEALKSALHKLVQRHDALRTRFLPTGEAFRIEADTALSFRETDASGQPETAQTIYDQQIEEEAHKAFDLVNGPVFRAHLVRLSDQEQALILSAHHIVCDGWSINVLVTELPELYAAELREGLALLPAALPFSRYASAQHVVSDEQKAAVETYWLNQFAPAPDPLVLPTDRPRDARQSFKGASLSAHISSDFYQALKKAGAQQGSTLFATLLAGFQAMLGRLAGQSDIVVGVPTAGQAQLDDEILVGHCVHFLPIRGQWTTQTTLAAHLKAVSKQVLDAYEHQGTTLGALVHKLDLPRPQGQVPLAQVQFNLERLDDHQHWPDLTVSIEPNPKAYVNFDLFLNIIESDQGLRLDCDYNSDLFDAQTISHWLEVYQRLLETLVSEPQQLLVKANWLPVSYAQQLTRLNQTARAYSDGQCLDQLLLARASTQPDALAVCCGGQTLTYAELELQTRTLANQLLSQLPDARAGVKVAVAVQRSVNTLIALLATLRAGAAYVPLDPSHPQARLDYILSDAAVSALITDGTLSVSVADLPVINLADEQTRLIDDSPLAPLCRNTEDLAYVIYTSGSTGHPKGVEISQGAIVNFLESMAVTPGLTDRDCFLAVTTVAFDISALELFLPLLTGARLIIAEDTDTGDGFRLKSLIESAEVTAMQGTASSWQLLLEAGFKAPAGFKMLIGGEALPRQLADRLLDSEGTLWNMYGPTETTVWSSCKQILADHQPITIGAPIANTCFYILDEQDQPVPLGMPGQLHIGGDSVAQGYLNRPELTADRFIHNPFGSGRLYRTGDLARFLSEGDIRVLGRIDDQVKLRGFRIEPGEIESELQRLGILSAVMVREDSPGIRRLVAYIEPQAGQPAEPAELRQALEKTLPDYMVPAAWMCLDKLPRLANGKLDRASLPEPEAAVIAGPEYVAPQNTEEQRLADIWAEVLGLPRVGRDDDLFALGADSIQLFRIVARAAKQDLVLSASLLMQGRTPAAVIRRLKDVTGSEAGKSKKPGRGRIRKLHPGSH